MKTLRRLLVLLTVTLCAATAVAVAQGEGTQPYNTLISDQATGFLASCTEVRVYGVDPIESARLTKEPLLSLAHPANPVLLQLSPGRYELVIWMFYLASEVHYMYFDVVDGVISAVDLMAVEFPAELVTY